jgi:hypothetical protein
MIFIFQGLAEANETNDIAAEVHVFTLGVQDIRRVCVFILKVNLARATTSM